MVHLDLLKLTPKLTDDSILGHQENDTNDNKCECRLSDGDMGNLCGNVSNDLIKKNRIETFNIETRKADQNSMEPPKLHPTYCPLATCHTSDLCAPCQRRFLIVIATPRSASTTLTWMFDDLPGVRMAGENNNALGYLKAATDNTANHKEFQKQVEMRSSWGHRFMPDQTLACANQKFIESISPPPLKRGKFVSDRNHTNDIVGFKTIRFFRGIEKSEVDRQDMVRYLNFNFPCSRIIVNVDSDLPRQAKSLQRISGFASSSQNQTKRLLVENGNLRWLATELGPQRAFLLDKDQWTKNISCLNEAISWLGFDDACHFRKLLAFNVGGYGKGRTKNRLRPECKRI